MKKVHRDGLEDCNGYNVVDYIHNDSGGTGSIIGDHIYVVSAILAVFIITCIFLPVVAFIVGLIVILPIVGIGGYVVFLKMEGCGIVAKTVFCSILAFSFILLPLVGMIHVSGLEPNLPKKGDYKYRMGVSNYESDVAHAKEMFSHERSGLFILCFIPFMLGMPLVGFLAVRYYKQYNVSKSTSEQDTSVQEDGTISPERVKQVLADVKKSASSAGFVAPSPMSSDAAASKKSFWYYYDHNGNKISATVAELKALAQRGEILPETIIENETGKTAPARKAKGLVFPETTAPLQPARSSVNYVHDPNSGYTDMSKLNPHSSKSGLDAISSQLERLRMHARWEKIDGTTTRFLNDLAKYDPRKYKEKLAEHEQYVGDMDRLFMNGVRGLNEEIQLELADLNRPDLNVDPAYRAAFKAKVQEVRDFLASLGR